MITDQDKQVFARAIGVLIGAAIVIIIQLAVIVTKLTQIISLLK